MNCHKRKKGFTLIELVLVLVIIAILAGIGIPVYFYIADQSLVSADTASLDYLNQVTAVYAANNGVSGSAFSGDTTNDARMQTLIDAGYYSSAVTPQRSGTTFEWLTVSQMWRMTTE